MAFDVNRSNVGLAANYTGIFIRYAFYSFGALMFGVVALVAITVWNRLPSSTSAAQPAFQFATSALSQRPQSRAAIQHASGWAERLQYGQLYDRDVDMTTVMIVPRPEYQNLTRDFNSEIGQLQPISARTQAYPRVFYDLETRFGPVRASEFSINSDGRVKLCVAYLSRFASPAFYLKGWYCEANGARPNYAAVACVLDKLTLQHPLPSDDANAFINEQMKRPARCTAEPVSQTTDTSPRQPLRRLLR